MKGARPFGEGLANHSYRVLRVCRCRRRRKEIIDISSRHEACEAYTGNSLLAAGSAARSQSNSAPKSVIAVATGLTPRQPTSSGSSRARFRRTAGVQERGTEKETCFRNLRDPHFPLAHRGGAFQPKEGCLSKWRESDRPTVLRDGSAGHTGRGTTTQRSLHRKHVPKRRFG